MTGDTLLKPKAIEPVPPGIQHDPHALYRDAPRNADAPQAVAWMRKTIRPFAAQEAGEEALGDADVPPYAQSLMLANALCEHMHWPNAWAAAALQAEWKQAQQKAAAALEAAEKAARRLLFEGASATRIIEASHAVFHRADMYPSRQAIVAMCARITQAGGRSARRVTVR